MRYLEKIFFGLNSREQTLLVIAMWSGLAIFFFKIFGDAVQTFEQWKLNEQVIRSPANT